MLKVMGLRFIRMIIRGWMKTTTESAAEIVEFQKSLRRNGVFSGFGFYTARLIQKNLIADL